MEISELDSVPETPSWKQFIANLQAPERELVLALPCAGIVGSRPTFTLLGAKTKAKYIYDLEDHYEQLLTAHFGKEHLHLGEKAGNIINVALEALTGHVDILLSGPPCPPWAGQGKHQGTADSRSKVKGILNL